MCANYKPTTRELLQQHFGVAPPDSTYGSEVYPGGMAPMIRLPHEKAIAGDRACALAMFGMVPHWADLKLARQTYNARSETVAAKPSFRSAWRKGQFCIIPAASIYEPCYETGKPVRWQIAHAQEAALGIAGIWEYRQDGPHGLPLLSFSMLTINADGHALMQRFHEPNKEKRMVVFLRPDQYDAWLTCPVEEAPAYLERFPAELLVAHPAPRAPRTASK